MSPPRMIHWHPSPLLHQPKIRAWQLLGSSLSTAVLFLEVLVLIQLPSHGGLDFHSACSTQNNCHTVSKLPSLKLGIREVCQKCK